MYANQLVISLGMVQYNCMPALSTLRLVHEVARSSSFLFSFNNSFLTGQDAVDSRWSHQRVYVSDLVTHVIAGSTEFPEYSDAKEYGLTVVLVGLSIV